MSQNVSPFRKAERKQVRLKIGISGPSGSGKTYSALRLAKGLGGRCAVIDTENGSASLYSHLFEFDTLELVPPFTTEKYLEAIEAASKAEYEVLIIDSISHQWKELLNRKEQLDARGGNSFANWAKVTPEHERFISSLTHSNIHLIATMRSKQDYAIGEGDRGKAKVQKVGLAPVQREGLEYEFTTVFDVAMNHEAEASKDRTGMFRGQIFQISEKTGEQMRDWLNACAAEAERLKARKARLDGVLAARGSSLPKAQELSKKLFDVEKIALLEDLQFEELLVAIPGEGSSGTQATTH